MNERQRQALANFIISRRQMRRLQESLARFIPLFETSVSQSFKVKSLRIVRLALDVFLEHRKCVRIILLHEQGVSERQFCRRRIRLDSQCLAEFGDGIGGRLLLLRENGAKLEVCLGGIGMLDGELPERRDRFWNIATLRVSGA